MTLHFTRAPSAGFLNRHELEWRQQTGRRLERRTETDVVQTDALQAAFKFDRDTKNHRKQ